MMVNNIYIFGAGTNGQQCLMNCRKRGIGVLAFLDNYTDKLLLDSVPVLRPDKADRGVPVVVTSPTFGVDIMLQLAWLGFENVIPLSRFYADLMLEPDWAGDLKRNRPEYDRVRGMLADDRSRTVFDGVVQFRRTLNPLYTAAIRSDIKDQWFDPEFFDPAVTHVFVDGGAYDGDTAEEFIRRCHEYKAAYLFEPSVKLHEAAVARLAKGWLRDVHFELAGLSDQRSQCKLGNAGLPSGSIGPDGEWITVVPLDEYDIMPTFIKLDVEGCEKAALIGAKGHITSRKPMIACAVYHRPEDIWELPQIISRMRGDYKFYLRHYTQFSHETVLYAI